MCIRDRKRTDLTLEQIILQMPCFMEVETDDTFSYKLCHGSDSMKTHYQLSICICRKLLPFVTDLLLRAKEKGEIHLNDPETAASFCLYGQLEMCIRDRTLTNKTPYIAVLEPAKGVCRFSPTILPNAGIS